MVYKGQKLRLDGIQDQSLSPSEEEAKSQNSGGYKERQDYFMDVMLKMCTCCLFHSTIFSLTRLPGAK